MYHITCEDGDEEHFFRNEDVHAHMNKIYSCKIKKKPELTT